MPVPAVENSEAPLSVLLGETVDGREIRELADKANRHSILTGVTGTGKTETLKTRIVGLSEIGVPTFLPDVKGDLDMIARVAPVKFWDLAGDRGETIMVSARDMGSLFFSRVLGLNETQSGVITIVFAVAKRYGLSLDTFDDVRAALNYTMAPDCRADAIALHGPDVDDETVEAMGRERKAEIVGKYGHVDDRTVGTIKRALLLLEEQNADQFFGRTSFSIDKLMQTHEGKGVVSLLRAETLIHSPAAYSCFLLWLLNELSRKMPEVGDQEKPKLAFFFDEAHALFDDAPRAFVKEVEKIVRMIRSKGISINMVSQGLADIPDAILAQLNNRIQHRLTGASQKDQKGLSIAAAVLPPNPKLGPLQPVIEKLGTGVALVSVLGQDGVPTMTEKVRIRRVDIPADASPIIVDRYEDEVVRMIREAGIPVDSTGNVLMFRRPETPVLGGFLDTPVEETEPFIGPTEPRETWEEGRAPVAEESPQEPVAALPVPYEPQVVETVPATIEPLLPQVPQAPQTPQAPQSPQTVTVQDHGLYAGRDVHIGTINVVHEAPVIAPPVIETPAWATPKPRKSLGLLRTLRLAPLLVVASATFWAASALLPIAVTVGSQTVVI